MGAGGPAPPEDKEKSPVFPAAPSEITMGSFRHAKALFFNVLLSPQSGRLSVQQSPNCAQNESHQQPAGACPPDEPEQVGTKSSVNS